jgi:hypothetical protein
MFCDDTNPNGANGKFLIKKDSDEIPCCKPSGIEEIIVHICKILHDLSYCQQPNKDLKESNEWCKIFDAFRGKADTNGTKTYVTDPGEKDEQWKDDKLI